MDLHFHLIVAHHAHLVNCVCSTCIFSWIAKVSDMGMGKQLDMSRSSFDSVVSGSIGWQAVEVLTANARLTKAIDVFSAGQNETAGKL